MTDELLIDVDDNIFERLSRRAEAHGVSIEEEALNILAAALLHDDVEVGRDRSGIRLQD